MFRLMTTIENERHKHNQEFMYLFEKRQKLLINKKKIESEFNELQYWFFIKKKFFENTKEYGAVECYTFICVIFLRFLSPIINKINHYKQTRIINKRKFINAVCLYFRSFGCIFFVLYKFLYFFQFFIQSLSNWR